MGKEINTDIELTWHCSKHGKQSKEVLEMIKKLMQKLSETSFDAIHKLEYSKSYPFYKLHFNIYNRNYWFEKYSIQELLKCLSGNEAKELPPAEDDCTKYQMLCKTLGCSLKMSSSTVENCYCDSHILVIDCYGKVLLNADYCDDAEIDLIYKESDEEHNEHDAHKNSNNATDNADDFPF